MGLLDFIPVVGPALSAIGGAVSTNKTNKTNMAINRMNNAFNAAEAQKARGIVLMNTILLLLFVNVCLKPDIIRI